MKNQLNALAAALSAGSLWALCMFLCTLSALYLGVAGQWADLMADMYPWYQVTLKGAFVGLAWGFVDGFIGAYLFVTLYNFFARKFGK